MAVSLLGGSSLGDLPRLRYCKRKRISSSDKTGGNNDYFVVPKGSTVRLAEIGGTGCVRHFWVTIECKDRWYLRKILLRMSWDGERNPSVEAPIGDFFGMGHGICKNYISAPLQMAPENGRGFNCWWPMPFGKSAVIEVENQCDTDIKSFYYYVDYEEYDEIEKDLGRFHATWHRENPTEGISEDGLSNREWLFGGTNLDGRGNYVILEAEGKGHYVGCNVSVHNLRETFEFNWYGEGDDMIFIDGEPLPSIIGTGTEDYCGMSWSPAQEYCAPYFGLPLTGERNWRGKITYYRYHILDPVYFEKSIRVTIEHGHANRRSDDYSSTAYWYQTEPHRRFEHMLPVEQRLPRE